MSDLRDGDDCCDEKSPLVRPPPLLFSTPRDAGGEEKSAKIWILLGLLSFWILLGLLSFWILVGGFVPRGAFATGSFSGWTECSVAPRL